MFSSAIGVLALSSALCAQPKTPRQQTAPSDQPQDQRIPDAPSAVQPPKSIPDLPAAAEPNSGATAKEAPGSNRTPVGAAPTPEPPPAGSAVASTPPPVNVRTVPAGGATKTGSDEQEQLFRIVKDVNQVLVPVTVKEESGRLLSGLSAKDFIVKENGKNQRLNFFTSDPFALSAAVVLDLGMKDVDVQKVVHTFAALEGAFSPFDEISIYSYSNAVGQLSSWMAAGQKLSETLAKLAEVHGRNNGPPVTSGPLGPQGPMINNMPVDQGAPIVYTPTQESHVLNDAILKAALDLSRRDPTRRKVIFVISDGREYRSQASYRDVLRVLLTNNIMVYAIGVGGTGIPGYSKLEKLHLPRFGYSDILPKYANASGGEVSNELTRTGIEDAYSRLIGDARNQYTLGYVTHEPLTGGHRDIEVVVDRPGCKRSSIRPCVDVTAKEGYYAVPPAR
jgi:VWFA-related protein